jgi:hypothetical protein
MLCSVWYRQKLPRRSRVGGSHDQQFWT